MGTSTWGLQPIRSEFWSLKQFFSLAPLIPGLENKIQVLRSSFKNPYHLGPGPSPSFISCSVPSLRPCQDQCLECPKSLHRPQLPTLQAHLRLCSQIPRLLCSPVWFSPHLACRLLNCEFSRARGQSYKPPLGWENTAFLNGEEIDFWKAFRIPHLQNEKKSRI